MYIASNRNMVLLGFTLSLVSVAFNSLVISYVNRRLKEVDEEHVKLLDSLERQSAALSDGDAQFDRYRIMHNLAFAVPANKTSDARNDAAGLLKSALTKYYAAANDIPQTEITAVEVEEIGQALPLMEKGLELARAMQAATNPVEKARLAKELEDLEKQLPEPKSDLARKLREVQKYSAAEYADSEAMLFSALMPVIKSWQEQVLTSSEKKRSRIRELQSARSALVRKSNYVSYGAIFFQLLGLMFILAKDLLKERGS
jgi:hypothetical protein